MNIKIVVNSVRELLLDLLVVNFIRYYYLEETFRIHNKAFRGHIF